MHTAKTADLMDLGAIDAQAMAAAIESGMTDLAATGCTTRTQIEPVEAEVMDLVDTVLAATEHL